MVSPDTPGSVRSVVRAGTIIVSVAERSQDGARLVDLATDTQLSKSTCHRLALQLVEMGLLEQDEEGRRFFPSKLWITLGAAAANNYGLSEIAAPALERLTRATHDTVHFFVRDGDLAMCVDMIIGDYPVKTIVMRIGERRPLGIGAASLALLAALPDEEVERVLSEKAMAGELQARGITDQSLRHHVSEARRQGYAVNDGMVVDGMTGLGVAIKSADGSPFAAISVAAISQRLSNSRREWVAELLRDEAGTVEEEVAGIARGNRRATERMLTSNLLGSPTLGRRSE